jgi:hypothetical protein
MIIVGWRDADLSHVSASTDYPEADEALWGPPPSSSQRA